MPPLAAVANRSMESEKLPLNDDEESEPSATTLEEEIRVLVIVVTVVEREECSPLATDRSSRPPETKKWLRTPTATNILQKTITDFFEPKNDPSSPYA